MTEADIPHRPEREKRMPPGMDAETVRRMATAASNAIPGGWALWVPQMLATWATWLENAESEEAQGD